jgi:hypothetical protein
MNTIAKIIVQLWCNITLRVPEAYALSMHTCMISGKRKPTIDES